MNSNEEYLDELLRSMENKDASTNAALSRLQGEEEKDIPEAESIPETESVPEEVPSKEPLAEEEILLGDEELSAMEELMLGDGFPEAEELSEMEELPIEDEPPMEREFLSEKDTFTDELGGEEFPEAESGIEEQWGTETASTEAFPPEDVSEEDPLKSLLADLEQDIDENEDFGMSEDEIEALLNAAKENTGEEATATAESMPPSENDSDLMEIQELLQKVDSNEAVDENIFEEEEQKYNDLDEISEEEMLSESSEEPLPEEAEEKKSGKPGRKRKEKASGKARAKKEEKQPGKAGAFWSKIFSMLVEEVEEESLPEEAGQVALSDENKDILNELDKEEEKKGKAAGKKGKKEKKEKAEKPKKEKPKKEKKVKLKKEKPQKEIKEEPEEPRKQLPKKGIIVVFLFAFSCLAVIMLMETLFSKVVELGIARNAYDKGEYKEAYDGYYGYELSEEDEVRFQGATTILRVARKIDSYHNYTRLGQGLLALDALFEAVRMNDEIYLKAETYGVVSQVDGLYEQIYEILNQNYNLSKEQVEEINAEESNVTYTKKLEAIANGKEYIEPEVDSIPKEDLLPEEEQIFAGQETTEKTVEEEADTTEGEVVVVGSRK